MSEPDEAADDDIKEIESVLSEVLEDDELGTLAVRHDQLRSLQSKTEAMKKEVALRITSRMAQLGVDSVKVNGRRLGYKTTKYYGVAEGHEQDLRVFIEAVAPEMLVPASANIKKTIDAWLDRNPGQTPPNFISVTETRSLVNAKA